MKKSFGITIVLIILALALGSCTIVNEYESGIEVANKALPCVLELSAHFQASKSYATGFIIDDRGYVLTNAHAVTDKAGNIIYEAVEIKGKFYNSSEEYLLDIIAFDDEKDIAVLKFRRNDLTLSALEVGDSKNLSYGATIFTLGNAEGYGISMSKGIISVPQKNFKDSQTGITNQVIQIDAAVNSGSSGGPLLNIEGKVIGMISFKVKNEDDVNVEGIGFAIPSEIFMNFYYDSLDISSDRTEDLNDEENEESHGEDIGESD
ncbi:MAG: trypsin-like peptidase domain-containing protein [Bacillota bacterium]|jgi:serine protease Do|nr:trypsin-like peptidase domain-containing protein [Bacillota bacterium]HHU43529.1 trypsin-like serine protease [Clostridiales bacterium]